MNFNFDKSDNVLIYNEYCLILQDGTKVYKYVPQCGSCDEEPYYTDEFGNKLEDKIDESNAISCDTKCCTFTINSNRNGIQNQAFYSNFIWGSITANNWSDFITAFEFQGGVVQSYCPDTACNVTTYSLCGNIFNSELTYEDNNGDIQVIETDCSSPCCRQEDSVERCACIEGVKQTIQLGIYTDTGEDIGWYINTSTGENIKEPSWVDCSCDVECGNNLWLLLSKLNLADLTGTFPSIIQVANFGTGSIHPSGNDAGNSIRGWSAYAICSLTKPVDDSNGHYWIAGSINDYTITDVTIVNSDPIC